ncbi:hypothetical protein HA466_0105820 [Hirschfeldia incana]|nr:hypothetical protein HA466_0105820 [Hirschfeldia incana]
MLLRLRCFWSTQSAHNLQQTQTLPVRGPASPIKAESPTFNAPLEDHKNVILGSAAGVGGFMGMPGGTGMTLPLPSGTPLLGGSSAFSGLGGAMDFPSGGSVLIS